MKYLYKYLIIVSAAFLAFSCTDDFDELNTNPLALTEDKVDASLIGLAFAQAQYNTVNGVHWRFQISQNLFSDLYCQYYATTHPNFDSDRYTQVGRWSDLCWTSFYGQAAPNIKFTEDFTAENGLTLQNAMAKIWRVYGYHRMTDYYGPVPYSQFGNGETSVAYDEQQSMYANFFTTLDEAVSVLKSNAGGNAFGNNDQLYAGDVGMWLKFASTLRLRLAMRVKYVDPGTAKTEAEKAVADGVITDNAENGLLLTTSQSPNPINTITNWGEYRMSTLMESVLKGYDDPRTSTYFNPAADGDSDGDGNPFEGLRNGQSKIQLTDSKNLDHSDVGDHFQPSNLAGNAPIVVIRAAEAFFLRAEGALEGWNMGGGAKDLYDQGIRMSITEWTGTDDATIDAYINGTNPPADAGAPGEHDAVSDIPVAFDAGGSTERQLEQIITQKWLGLYPDGWESWAELRRTGYPKQYSRLNSENLDVGVNDIMRRMVYVTSEFDNNREGVDAAIQLSELGGSEKNGAKKLWWDKK